MILVSDKYLVEICTKQFKRGILLATLMSLLVFSSQVISPTIAFGIDECTQSTTSALDLLEECPYTDDEICAHQQLLLASAPVAELLKAPIIFKLVVLFFP